MAGLAAGRPAPEPDRPDGIEAAPPPVCDDDHVRGDRNGRLVVLYADFACPYCASVEVRLRALPVRIVFRHFARSEVHSRAVAAACAAEAAGRQGAFWPMHDALFADQGRLDDPHLWARAERLGLDVEAFERDRRGDEVARRVERDLRGGMAAGVRMTPTLVVDATRHDGRPSPQLWERLAANGGVN